MSSSTQDWKRYQEREGKRAAYLAANPVKVTKSTWVCSCGHKLPKTGYVWKHRYAGHTEGRPSAYVCDGCADARESGMDY